MNSQFGNEPFVKLQLIFRPKLLLLTTLLLVASAAPFARASTVASDDASDGASLATGSNGDTGLMALRSTNLLFLDSYGGFN